MHIPPFFFLHRFSYLIDNVESFAYICMLVCFLFVIYDAHGWLSIDYSKMSEARSFSFQLLKKDRQNRQTDIVREAEFFLTKSFKGSIQSRRDDGLTYEGRR